MKLFKVISLIILAHTMIFAKTLSNEDLSKLGTFTKINAKVTSSVLIAKNMDLYLVEGKDTKGQAFNVVIDKDGKYLFLTNKVINTKTQEQVSIPIDISILKGKALFTYGTGKREINVFTDPECPYCHKFEASWEKIKKDVKINVFFFNLDFHKNANAMSRWILSAKTNEAKTKRLSEIGKGSTEYKKAKFTNDEISKLNTIINKSKKLGEELGVRGTPSVYDMQGKSINWTSLVK